jgi:hypothetical protein
MSETSEARAFIAAALLSTVIKGSVSVRYRSETTVISIFSAISISENWPGGEALPPGPGSGYAPKAAATAD